MFRQRISPPCVCKWIGPLAAEESFVLVPVILHRCIVDDEFVVQVDGRPVAELANPEGVPFAERLVGKHKRVLPFAPFELFQRPPLPLSAPRLNF